VTVFYGLWITLADLTLSDTRSDETDDKMGK
jgi:hypothetical protein